MRTIREIILHCSDTEEGTNFYAKDIDLWHKRKGWKCIGYHYVIDLDGTVERGRMDEEMGAHCYGHNKHSIGICYIGGKNKQGKHTDTRTEAQKYAMQDLVYLLLEQYHLTLKDVKCHHDYDSTKVCPCFNIDDFRKELTNSMTK